MVGVWFFLAMSLSYGRDLTVVGPFTTKAECEAVQRIVAENREHKILAPCWVTR